MKRELENLECRNGNYYHKVKGTETLWTISKKYNVDIQKLMELNGINNVKITQLDYILVFKGEL